MATGSKPCTDTLTTGNIRLKNNDQEFILIDEDLFSCTFYFSDFDEDLFSCTFHFSDFNQVYWWIN